MMTYDDWMAMVWHAKRIGDQELLLSLLSQTDSIQRQEQDWTNRTITKTTVPPYEVGLLCPKCSTLVKLSVISLNATFEIVECAHCNAQLPWLVWKTRNLPLKLYQDALREHVEGQELPPPTQSA